MNDNVLVEVFLQLLHHNPVDLQRNNIVRSVEVMAWELELLIDNSFYLFN